MRRMKIPMAEQPRPNTPGEYYAKRTAKSQIEKIHVFQNMGMLVVFRKNTRITAGLSCIHSWYGRVEDAKNVPDLPASVSERLRNI